MNDPIAFIRAHAETIAVAYSQTRHDLTDRTATVRIEGAGSSVVISLREGDRAHVVTVDDRRLELYVPATWRDYTFAMVRAEIERI